MVQNNQSQGHLQSHSSGHRLLTHPALGIRRKERLSHLKFHPGGAQIRLGGEGSMSSENQTLVRIKNAEDPFQLSVFVLSSIRRVDSCSNRRRCLTMTHVYTSNSPHLHLEHLHRHLHRDPQLVRRLDPQVHLAPHVRGLARSRQMRRKCLRKRWTKTSRYDLSAQSSGPSTTAPDDPVCQ